MPLYEFHCKNCGSFEYWRPLDQASTPMICPLCQTEARRAYTAPGLVKTSPALTHALYRSEKSGYEPEVLQRERPLPSDAEKPSQVTYQSHGRPWQLGH